jgi:hypothetical protein
MSYQKSWFPLAHPSPNDHSSPVKASPKPPITLNATPNSNVAVYAVLLPQVPSPLSQSYKHWRQKLDKVLRQERVSERLDDRQSRLRNRRSEFWLVESIQLVESMKRARRNKEQAEKRNETVEKNLLLAKQTA